MPENELPIACRNSHDHLCSGRVQCVESGGGYPRISRRPNVGATKQALDRHHLTPGPSCHRQSFANGNYRAKITPN